MGNRQDVKLNDNDMANSSTQMTLHHFFSPTAPTDPSKTRKRRNLENVEAKKQRLSPEDNLDSNADDKSVRESTRCTVSEAELPPSSSDLEDKHVISKPSRTTRNNLSLAGISKGKNRQNVKTVGAEDNCSASSLMSPQERCKPDAVSDNIKLQSCDAMKTCVVTKQDGAANGSLSGHSISKSTSVNNNPDEMIETNDFTTKCNGNSSGKEPLESNLVAKAETSAECDTSNKNASVACESINNTSAEGTAKQTSVLTKKTACKSENSRKGCKDGSPKPEADVTKVKTRCSKQVGELKRKADGKVENERKEVSKNRSRHSISDSDSDSDLDAHLQQYLPPAKSHSLLSGNHSRSYSRPGSRPAVKLSEAAGSVQRKPRAASKNISSDDTQSYSMFDYEQDINDNEVDRPLTSFMSFRGSRAALHQQDESTKRKNIEFYKNEISSVPSGDKIDTILRDWKGNYSKLEIHHGYIQWLFPLPERGLNLEAQPLQPEEAKFLRTDANAQRRLVSAYRMMLDFYGIELVDETTGKLQRAANWKERLDHLNKSSHNFLRITRILKCFGEVGLEHLQPWLVYFLACEAFDKKTLVNAQRSCRSFWLPTVLDPVKKKKIENMLAKYSGNS